MATVHANRVDTNCLISAARFIGKHIYFMEDWSEFGDKKHLTYQRNSKGYVKGIMLDQEGDMQALVEVGASRYVLTADSNLETIPMRQLFRDAELCLEELSG